MLIPIGNRVRRQWLLLLVFAGLFTLSLASCSTRIPTPVLTSIVSSTSTVQPPTSTPAPVIISPITAPELERVASFGKGWAQAVTWSPDGKTIAVATSLGVDLYDAEIFTQTGFLDTGQAIVYLAFSPDGQLLAAGGRSVPLQIWDVHQQQRRYTLTSSDSPLVFSPAGTKVAAADYETLRVWDALTGEVLASFPGYPNGIKALAFSPDGTALLAAGSGGIRLRDLTTGELLYPPIDVDAEAIFFNPDGKQFSALSYTHVSTDWELNTPHLNYEITIYDWDTETGKALTSLKTGKDIVYGVAVSPDQRWIVTGGLEGISVWDTTAKVIEPAWKGQTGAVNALAFSPDGKQLAAIEWAFGGDDSVRIWDFDTREVLETLDEYSGSLVDVALSRDGKWVASVGMNHVVQIRETNDGQLIDNHNGNQPLSISPDGQYIVFASGGDKEIPMTEYSFNDSVELLPLQAGELQDGAKFYCPSAVAVAFSSDGQLMAYGGEQWALTIRDTHLGDIVRLLGKAQSYDIGTSQFYIESLAFSPDGRMLAVGGHYKIEIWDIQTGDLLNTIEGLNFGTQIAFSPDGRFLAMSGFSSIDQNAQVRLWDVASSQPVFSFATQQSRVNHLAFSPDGQVLAIGGDASYGSTDAIAAVELWDAWVGEPIRMLPLSGASIVGLGFSADGQTLMMAGDNGSIQLWQVPAASTIAITSRATPTAIPTPTPIPTSAPTSIPLPVKFAKITTLGEGSLSPITRSPNGKLIALMNKGSLVWFDATTFELLGSLPFENSWEGGQVYFSSNSELIVVEEGFGATIVDLAKQEVLGSVWGGNGFASGYTFSPDSRYMAYLVGDRTTGGPYYYIGLFDSLTGKDIGFDPYVEDGYHFKTLLPDRYHVMTNPAISPDGKLVAAGHSDKRVYVWDLESGQTRFLLEGHAGSVTGVDFSPNGRYLASGSRDGTVRLWSPATGQLVRVITGLPDDVTGVKFSDDGQRLTIYVSGQSAEVWDMQTGRLGPLVEPEATPDPFSLYMHQQGYADSGWITLTLFSPDGRNLAVARGNVLIWDVVTHELVAALESVEDNTIVGLAYSSDGVKLAAVDERGNILVWNTHTGGRLLSVTSEMLLAGQAFYAAGSDGVIGIGAKAVGEQGIAFSPDGTRLAIGNGPAIEIWDIQTASKITAFDQTAPPAYITRISFSKDGQRLSAVLNRNRRAAIWDANTGAILREIDLPKVDPNAFTTTDLNGPLFARNNYDEQSYWIELWNLETGDMLRLDAPARDTEPLRFSPDGRLLSAVNANSLYFWETQTGRLIYKTKDTFSLEGLAFSPDNTQLALGVYGKAELWDIGDIRQLADQPVIPSITLGPTPTPKISTWPTSTPSANPTLSATTEPAFPTGAISPINAAHLTELAHYGDGTIEQVIWSPKGDLITVAGSQGIYQYDASTLTETARMESGYWADSVVTVPDGRILAAGMRDNGIAVWEPATGQILAELEGGSEPTLSPNGKWLVYVNGQGDLQTWNLEAHQPLATLLSSTRTVHQPVFSPDGKWVAAIQDAVRVWDTQTGAIVNALGGPDNTLTDLSFSSDGQYLVGAGDGSAWIWDTHPGTEPHTLTLYTGKIDGNLDVYENTVTAAALSPDNRIVALGDSEKTIWLFDRRTRRLLNKLEGHASIIRRLSFSPDGKTLVSVDGDGRLMTWEVTSGKQLNTLHTHLGELNGLVFRTDGNLAVWEGGTALTIRPSDGALLGATYIYSGTLLAASPDGNWLATYSPYQVSLWDASTGDYRQTLEGEAEEPFVDYYWEGLVFRGFHGAAFSPDGSRLATTGTGGMWVYETSSGRLLQKFPGNNAYAPIFSSDGQWVIASLDIQAWPPGVLDLENGEELFILEEPASTYLQYAFSPDKYWLGAVTKRWNEPSQLELWDTSTHQLFKSLPFSQDIPLTSLAFSPVTGLVAVGQADGQIFVIDLTTFDVLTTLQGHGGKITQLAFSPDGRYLVEGGSDGAVHMWGVP